MVDSFVRQHKSKPPPTSSESSVSCPKPSPTPMALSPPPPFILQFPLHSPSPAPPSLFFCRKNVELCATALFAAPISVRVSWSTRCLRSATQEDQWNDPDALGNGGVRSDADGVDAKVEDQSHDRSATAASSGATGSLRVSTSSFGDSLSLGIREPVYEVSHFFFLFIKCKSWL